MSSLQKINDIEAELARTQKNKATMAHICALKARLAQLKRELIASESKKGGGKGEGFDVQKTGDARIGFIGFPSVGKSTLLSKMTSTHSEVAAYEFTTLTCVPGVVNYRGAKLQMLDLPGIIEGAKDGKGRGRQIIAVARTCSLILIVLDVVKPLQHKLIIERELDGFGIRLNKLQPDIVIRKKDRGGISISSTCPLTQLDQETIKTILGEYRMSNADVTFRGDYTADELIDAIEGNRAYIPAIYVLNKIDQISIEELDIIARIPHNCPISAHHEWNLDGLLECIWDHLNFIRVYTKPKGQVPDYDAPVILKKLPQPSVEGFCNRIHRQLMHNYKYAWVWGSSVKHQPQRVGKDHLLDDEDVVQVVKKV
ncbi:developmentally regulated GTP-binding protein 1, putative [Leishmania panamensis]|uniref:Developmentally regulated GTP-binding protein 1, putative n=4 Tax=Viannia TaxID=37616 RepID=A0A088S2C6_LEIPA|nr:developmentally regulated GTP-binding protein 1, putative [Leishmania panamensis]AIO02371.1 developmentally regulated GTP-binding protein 1, putative [Leishmania panamensis]CCM19572.1 developmentally regulated GTP-binding protein 1,putative [Leishmania guyanensis]